MDSSDVTLERMRTFVRVAERGSLSAVAREFGVGQSTVTRHLRELEEAVGGASAEQDHPACRADR